MSRRTSAAALGALVVALVGTGPSLAQAAPLQPSSSAVLPGPVAPDGPTRGPGDDGPAGADPADGGGAAGPVAEPAPGQEPGVPSQQPADTAEPVSFDPAAAEPVTDEELVSDLETAIAVTDDFWAEHLPEDFGLPYVPPRLASGVDGVPGLYDGRVDDLRCGQQRLPVGNAAYCSAPGAHWVAADLTLLRSAQQLGDAFIYVVLAHEWGHAVQAHLPAEALWPAYELQADCFSGAALQGATDAGTLLLEPADAEEVVGSYAALDDTAWGDGGTHGSAEERYAAFSRGATEGPQGCLAR